MGACASKPKVLGDKPRPRSRRRSSSNATARSFSSTSIKRDKGSLSLSAAPNKEESSIATAMETEDVGSQTFVANHYQHNDELPSKYDDDDHFDNHHHNIDLGTPTKDETDLIISEVTTSIKEDKKGVVEEPKLIEEMASGPTPTHELQDHISNESSEATPTFVEEPINPAGLQPQNDVVEMENPTATLEVQNSSPHDHTDENDVVVSPEVQHSDSPPIIENDVIESSSPTTEGSPHKNDVVEALSTDDAVHLQLSPPRSNASENGVVETTLEPDEMQTLIGSTCHHSNEELLMVDPHGPTKILSVDEDHMPSTFAF